MVCGSPSQAPGLPKHLRLLRRATSRSERDPTRQGAPIASKPNQRPNKPVVKNHCAGATRLCLSKRAGRNFFVPIVKWITSLREIPGQAVAHRAAQADFNVRGGKAVWRYTAPTALFFGAGRIRPLAVPKQATVFLELMPRLALGIVGCARLPRATEPDGLSSPPRWGRFFATRRFN